MIVFTGLLLGLLVVASETEHSGEAEREYLVDKLGDPAETDKTTSVEIAMANFITCTISVGGTINTICMEVFSSQLPGEHRDTMVNCTVTAFEECVQPPEDTLALYDCMASVQNCTLLVV